MGTLPVNVTCCITDLTTYAAILASHATFNTTSSRQLVYTVDNADNNGGKDVVPTEFAGDCTDTQHLATSGDDDGTNDAAHTQQYATVGDYDGTPDPTTNVAASPAALHSCVQVHNVVDDFWLYPHSPLLHMIQGLCATVADQLAISTTGAPVKDNADTASTIAPPTFPNNGPLPWMRKWMALLDSRLSTITSTTRLNNLADTAGIPTVEATDTVPSCPLAIAAGTPTSTSTATPITTAPCCTRVHNNTSNNNAVPSLPLVVANDNNHVADNIGRGTGAPPTSTNDNDDDSVTDSKDDDNVANAPTDRPTFEHPVLCPNLPSIPTVHPQIHNNSPSPPHLITQDAKDTQDAANAAPSNPLESDSTDHTDADYDDASSNNSGDMQQNAVDNAAFANADNDGDNNSTGDAATGGLRGYVRMIAAIATDPTAPPLATPFAAGLLNLFDNLSANSTAQKATPTTLPGSISIHINAQHKRSSVNTRHHAIAIGNTQQLATAGDDAGTNDAGDMLQHATAGDDAGTTDAIDMHQNATA